MGRLGYQITLTQILNSIPILFILGEVHLMVNMVKTLDAFTGYQTRMVVVVDGLGSDFVS